MKAVLLSIRPQYCELIASGEKTVEVRKTKPKIDTPFKCYIYQTQPKQSLIEVIRDGDELYGETYHGKTAFITTPKDVSAGNRTYGRWGKVIGEFVCDEIQVFHYGIQTPEDARSWQDCYEGYDWDLYFEDGTMLSRKEIDDYGAGKFICAWHISDLVIYDKPKALGEFLAEGRQTYDCPILTPLKRPPQSWRYVEELC